MADLVYIVRVKDYRSSGRDGLDLSPSHIEAAVESTMRDRGDSGGVFVGGASNMVTDAKDIIAAPNRLDGPAAAVSLAEAVLEATGVPHPDFHFDVPSDGKSR